VPKHAVTLALSIAEKTCDVTGTPGARETIEVTLSNLSFNGVDYGADDLRLWIIGRIAGERTLLAKVETFTDNGDDTFSGELDLNTEEIESFFSGCHDQATKPVTVCIKDVTNDDTILNDTIEIQNCPLTDDMADPNTVDPVAAVDYAPLANGVTNGDDHDHSGGDGAQIDHTTLSNRGTTTHAQIDAWKVLVDAAATAAGGILKCNRLALKQPNGSFREIVVDDDGVIGTGGTV
jgi:hypothetical protein